MPFDNLKKKIKPELEPNSFPDDFKMPGPKGLDPTKSPHDFLGQILDKYIVGDEAPVGDEIRPSSLPENLALLGIGGTTDRMAKAFMRDAPGIVGNELGTIGRDIKPTSTGWVPESEWAPPFYSKLIRMLEEKMGRSATPQQIEGMVKGNIKEGEISWLKLREYLKDKDKVDKEQLLKHLNENFPQLKDVVRTENHPAKDALKAAEDEFKLTYRGDKYKDDEYDLISKIKEGKADVASMPEALRHDAQALREAAVNLENSKREITKFSNPSYGGSENYRERLTTLPVKHGHEIEQLETEMAKINKQLDQVDTLKKHPLNPFKNGVEELKLIGQLKEYRDKINNLKKENYYHSHWDEQPNVVSHTRLNDREYVDGKKGLHAEEIQSDWQRAGREHGYQKPGDVKEPLPNWSTINSHSPVPDMPFKTDWHEFQLKKLLREGAEKNADRISFTPGAEQIARNSGSKKPETFLNLYDKMSPGFLNKFGKKYGDTKVGAVDAIARPHYRFGYVGPSYTEGELLNLANRSPSPMTAQLQDLAEAMNKGKTFEEAIDKMDSGWDIARYLGGQLNAITTPRVKPTHSFDYTPEMMTDILKKGFPLWLIPLLQDPSEISNDEAKEFKTLREKLRNGKNSKL